MANVKDRTDVLEDQVARLGANQVEILTMMGELKAAMERMAGEQAGRTAGQDNGSAADQDNGNGEVEAMELGAEEPVDAVKGEKNKADKDKKDMDMAGEAKERKDMSGAMFGYTDIR